MKSKKWLFIIPLLLIFLLGSCSPGEKDEAVRKQYLENEIQKKFNTQKSILIRNFREKILEEANKRADSILLIQAREEQGIAIKPTKPEKPALEQIDDSFDIKPIFKIQDTLIER